jgi:hypothetical protein
LATKEQLTPPPRGVRWCHVDMSIALDYITLLAVKSVDKLSNNILEV